MRGESTRRGQPVDLWYEVRQTVKNPKRRMDLVMKRTSLAILSLFVLLTASAASAQDVRTVSLAEVRATASENAIDVLTARMNEDFARLAARSARRPFVPTLGLSATWADRVSLVAEGTRDRSLSYEASLGWTLPIGTRLSAAAGSTEFFSGSSFVPQPTTTVSLSAAQPLLEGGWNSSNLLDRADLEIELQRALFVDSLNAFIVEVDRAYWNLAETEADVEIKRRSRDRAKQQFEDTKANIERGILAPGEIFVVEENLVIFEQQLLRSLESLELARLRLARLMRVPPETPLSTGGELDSAEADAPEFEAALASAMGNNPALVATEISKRQADVVIDFEENRRLPSLDLAASIFSVGTDEDRSTAWGQALTADSLDYRVGLDFSIPLDFGPDNARVESARLSRREAELDEEDAHDTIHYGLRGLYARYVRRIVILERAEKLVGLAEQKLATERDKYKSGLSTLIDVVRFQRDLDGALIAAKRARVDVLVLTSEIAQLQGTLYSRAGLELR